MKTIDEMLVGCEHDGSYIPVSEVKRLMKEYAKDMKKEKVNSANSKLPILDVSGMLHPDIEKLLRYAVRQWSNLNEQRELDHDDLVQHWLDGDCKKWIKKYCI